MAAPELSQTLVEDVPASAEPSQDPAPPIAQRTDLQVIPMRNGVLWVAEVSKEIGFPVHRAYFIRDVPDGEGRGGSRGPRPRA